MELGAWIGIAVGTCTLAATLIGVGFRIGRLETRVLDLDRDVIALAPIVSQVNVAITQFQATAELFTAHISAHGHEWSVERVTRHDEQIAALRESLERIEKRKGLHDEQPAQAAS